MEEYLELYQQFGPPHVDFDRRLLGPEFPRELETVSRLWFSCGYRPGIAAYLNFFLLREFIVTHDTAFPPRFQTFASMAKSFYQTDLFIREITDSGARPTGGISSEAVRATLKGIMKRHQRISIPDWMMTYFGFSLLEMVEKQCSPLTEEEKRLHLAYMAKAYRIMGFPFSERRDWMERFSRSIEEVQSGASSNLQKHARNILLLGEMAGVSSVDGRIEGMLPERPRSVFKTISSRVRPNLFKRAAARGMGRLLMKQAVGKPRKAVPVALAAFLLLSPLGHAHAFSNEVDEYVAWLGGPQARQTLGIEKVSRPEQAVNVLEVTFDGKADQDARAKIMHRIARDFLRVLFRDQRLTTASVVERDKTDRILDHLVIRVAGEEAPTMPGKD